MFYEQRSYVPQYTQVKEELYPISFIFSKQHLSTSSDIFMRL